MTPDTPQEARTASRAFVLGFDGVPWWLIQEWAAEGHLPNFARLLREGTAGPLASTTPASTPLAWPSIATGVHPDKHGVYSFQRLTERHTHEMYTGDDVRQPALWDLVSPATVANVPMTYPADDIDGRMIAGVMTPEVNDRYTSPTELADRIQSAVPDHEISLRWGEYVGREEAFVEDITSLLEARREVMEFLLDDGDDWRLFFFTYMEPDRLQHLVWDREVLLDHYRRLDDIVGDAMAAVEQRDANLFIVSDHGFGPVSKTVCANHVLESEGYLHRQEGTGTRGLLSRVGLTKSRLRDAMDAVGLDERALIKKYLPRPVVDALAAQVPGSHSVYDLDYDRTQAVVHEFGNLYVNDTERFEDGAVDPDDVDGLKRELRSVFESITDPDTGEPVLEVRDGDSVFPTDPRSPDLVLEPAPEYEVGTGLTSSTFDTPEADAGHRKDGIFLAWGPDVAEGVELDGPSVVDVAPTVLHSLGEPVPDNADGSVLADALLDDASPVETTVATERRPREASADESADEDMGSVKERLQGLGYMEE